MRKKSIIMVVVCGLFFSTSVVFAAEIISTAVEKDQEFVFNYNPEGRREPFKPLIGQPPEPPKATPNPGDKILEKYDLNQFKLTGIILGELGNYARVLAPDGNSYTIKEGTRIGVFEGKVISISENTVLVKEIKHFNDGTVKHPETPLYLKPLEKSTKPEGTLFLLSKL